MTRARALKTAIRTRAAKTGERYTTARRHVLNELRAQSPALVRFPAAAPATPKPSSSPAVAKGGLSDAKVREKTGHGLDYWFDVLDRFGGVARGHTALARHLYQDHSVPGWHSQGITVAYERARGARAVNQRCDGQFEVSVSKVVNASVSDVVTALENKRARARWIKGVDQALSKGLSAAFDARPARGVVVRPDGQGRFRYTWNDTTVQIYFLPKAGDKLSVVVTNSKLASAAMVEERRALWRAALNALAQSVARS